LEGRQKRTTSTTENVEGETRKGEQSQQTDGINGETAEPTCDREAPKTERGRGRDEISVSDQKTAAGPGGEDLLEAGTPTLEERVPKIGTREVKVA